MNIDEAIKFLQQADPIMGKLIKKFDPPNLKPNQNHFKSLVRSIIYQQLSGASASMIYDRFKNLLDDEKSLNSDNILKIHSTELKKVGLSKQKIIYLKELSKQWHGIQRKFSNISMMSNHEISKTLLKVKGIGQWTVDMFLIFTLAREDVFPSGDLAIKKGFATIRNMDTLPTEKFMKDESKIWKPFRTVASLYLWKITDGEFEW
jgi:DNA-3-methyladenine glycosylase II